MNYASYRSAMLEAWRVFRSRRKWLGEKLCQPVWSMLMEEAYVRKRLKVKAFYRNMFDYTCCEWIGPPKGQIEPIKEVSADVLSIKHGLKSREETMLEQGREFNRTMAQIQKEQKTINDKGIVFESGSNGDGGDDLPGTTVGKQMLIPFEADAEFESEMESKHGNS
jgi:capsid protein